MRRLLILVYVLIFLAMLGITIRASLDRDVFTAAAEVWADPWGKALFADAYFAFFTVWLWMAYRERSWWSRLAWLVAVLTTGNFAIAVYALMALARHQPGDWATLVLGRRAAAQEVE
ncbi:MAG: DUF1475 domain-containing protein [Acidobacteriota bacterium]